MIEVHELSKRYRANQAVDGLSFTVQAGQVTAFIGPNGAGKSTTFRILLGLDRPDSGHALIDSTPYDELQQPVLRVGALLDANAAHPGRTARNHLLCIAQAAGIDSKRVDAVLELTGLGEAGSRRVGGYSLGMRQRLGIAAALLGDPAVLLLDEPVNGLDPEGVRWIRRLLRQLADEGRTVFVSSHLMSELQLVADHLIVIGRGRLIADTPLSEFTAGGRSLEDAYLELTDGATQYRTERTN
ncbi:ABC-2 type transport system ATP-binding protein [Kribbella voronezhensis]|uniref:ABC-2 type transport system ATP-binding protein n=1 Tax=Kribbella voronezhensis TaxID=2512212 RepID=A0A4R7SZS6_9ACTN|nr:ABC-2 type transport system ATP-binding protein [Kribbella voronezhensis]